MKSLEIERSEFEPDLVDIKECAITGRLIVPLIQEKLITPPKDNLYLTFAGIMAVSFGLLLFGQAKGMNQVQMFLLLLPVSLIGIWMLARNAKQNQKKPRIKKEKGYLHIQPHVFETFNFEHHGNGTATVKMSEGVEIPYVRNIETLIKAWAMAKSMGFKAPQTGTSQ